jgi:hypothetical protein
MTGERDSSSMERPGHMGSALLFLGVGRRTFNHLDTLARRLPYITKCAEVQT